MVEDEPRIAADIRSGLERANYAVDTAADGEDAWFKGETEDYDAIVLDLGLPASTAPPCSNDCAAPASRTPVLILTALDGWRDKVEGIDAGADDYLTKPFRMEELMARLRAITRRAAGQASASSRRDRWRSTLGRAPARSMGRDLGLSAMEYRLLAYLVLHRGRTMSQGELLEHIHSGDTDRDINAIEALIARAAQETRRSPDRDPSGPRLPHP